MAEAAVTLLAIPCSYHYFKIFDTNRFFKTLLIIKDSILLHVDTQKLHSYVTVLKDGCSNGFIHLVL